MLSDAEKGCFEIIICKEISRFSRNILDTISLTRKLKAHGVAVIFMNDGINTLDSDAELRLSILGSIAQEESRRTSQRVKWGQTRQMEKGLVFGHSLLGYRLEKGRLSIVPSEADTVREIFYKYGVEKKSSVCIAEELNRENSRAAPQGKHWSSTAVLRVLKNEKYTGDLIQKKNITPDYLSHEKRKNRGEEPFIAIYDHHEAIVSRELWNTVQQELSKRGTKQDERNFGSCVHCFSGKIYCGECGSSFVARQRRLKDGSVTLRWCCGKALREGLKGCGVGSLVTDKCIRNMFNLAMSSLELDMADLSKKIGSFLYDACVVSRWESNISRLDDELSALKKKHAAALDAYISGKITEAELQLIRKRYDNDVSALSKQKRDLNSARAEALSEEAVISGCFEILKSPERHDHLCRLLTDKIIVYADKSAALSLSMLPYVFYFEEQ